MERNKNYECYAKDFVSRPFVAALGLRHEITADDVAFALNLKHSVFNSFFVYEIFYAADCNSRLRLSQRKIKRLAEKIFAESEVGNDDRKCDECGLDKIKILVKINDIKYADLIEQTTTLFSMMRKNEREEIVLDDIISSDERKHDTVELSEKTIQYQQKHLDDVVAQSQQDCEINKVTSSNITIDQSIYRHSVKKEASTILLDGTENYSRNSKSADPGYKLQSPSKAKLSDSELSILAFDNYIRDLDAIEAFEKVFPSKRHLSFLKNSIILESCMKIISETPTIYSNTLLEVFSTVQENLVSFKKPMLSICRTAEKFKFENVCLEDSKDMNNVLDFLLVTSHILCRYLRQVFIARNHVKSATFWQLFRTYLEKNYKHFGYTQKYDYHGENGSFVDLSNTTSEKKKMYINNGSLQWPNRDFTHTMPVNNIQCDENHIKEKLASQKALINVHEASYQQKDNIAKRQTEYYEKEVVVERFMLSSLEIATDHIDSVYDDKIGSHLRISSFNTSEEIGNLLAETCSLSDDLCILYKNSVAITILLQNKQRIIPLIQKILRESCFMITEEEFSDIIISITDAVHLTSDAYLCKWYTETILSSPVLAQFKNTVKTKIIKNLVICSSGISSDVLFKIAIKNYSKLGVSPSFFYENLQLGSQAANGNINNEIRYNESQKRLLILDTILEYFSYFTDEFYHGEIVGVFTECFSFPRTPEHFSMFLCLNNCTIPWQNKLYKSNQTTLMNFYKLFFTKINTNYRLHANFFETIKRLRTQKLNASVCDMKNEMLICEYTIDDILNIFGVMMGNPHERKKSRDLFKDAGCNHNFLIPDSFVISTICRNFREFLLVSNIQQCKLMIDYVENVQTICFCFYSKKFDENTTCSLILNVLSSEDLFIEYLRKISFYCSSIVDLTFKSHFMTFFYETMNFVKHRLFYLVERFQYKKISEGFQTKACSSSSSDSVSDEHVLENTDSHTVNLENILSHFDSLNKKKLEMSVLILKSFCKLDSPQNITDLRLTQRENSKGEEPAAHKSYWIHPEKNIDCNSNKETATNAIIEKHIIGFIKFVNDLKNQEIDYIMNLLPFLPAKQQYFAIYMGFWTNLLEKNNVEHFKFFCMKTPALINFAEFVRKDEKMPTAFHKNLNDFLERHFINISKRIMYEGERKILNNKKILRSLHVADAIFFCDLCANKFTLLDSADQNTLISSVLIQLKNPEKFLFCKRQHLQDFENKNNCESEACVTNSSNSVEHCNIGLEDHGNKKRTPVEKVVIPQKGIEIVSNSSEDHLKDSAALTAFINCIICTLRIDKTDYVFKDYKRWEKTFSSSLEIGKKNYSAYKELIKPNDIKNIFSNKILLAILYTEIEKINNFNYSGIIEYITDPNILKNFYNEIAYILKIIHFSVRSNQTFLMKYILSLIELYRNTYISTKYLILEIVSSLMKDDVNLCLHMNIHHQINSVIHEESSKNKFLCKNNSLDLLIKLYKTHFLEPLKQLAPYMYEYLLYHVCNAQIIAEHCEENKNTRSHCMYNDSRLTGTYSDRFISSKRFFTFIYYLPRLLTFGCDIFAVETNSELGLLKKADFSTTFDGFVVCKSQEKSLNSTSNKYQRFKKISNLTKKIPALKKSLHACSTNVRHDNPDILQPEEIQNNVVSKSNIRYQAIIPDMVDSNIFLSQDTVNFDKREQGLTYEIGDEEDDVYSLDANYLQESSAYLKAHIFSPDFNVDWLVEAIRVHRNSSKTVFLILYILKKRLLKAYNYLDLAVFVEVYKIFGSRDDFYNQIIMKSLSRGLDYNLKSLCNANAVKYLACPIFIRISFCQYHYSKIHKAIQPDSKQNKEIRNHENSIKNDPMTNVSDHRYATNSVVNSSSFSDFSVKKCSYEGSSMSTSKVTENADCDFRTMDFQNSPHFFINDYSPVDSNNIYYQNNPERYESSEKFIDAPGNQLESFDFNFSKSANRTFMVKLLKVSRIDIENLFYCDICRKKTKKYDKASSRNASKPCFYFLYLQIKDIEIWCQQSKDIAGESFSVGNFESIGSNQNRIHNCIGQCTKRSHHSHETKGISKSDKTDKISLQPAFALKRISQCLTGFFNFYFANQFALVCNAELAKTPFPLKISVFCEFNMSQMIIIHNTFCRKFTNDYIKGTFKEAQEHLSFFIDSNNMSVIDTIVVLMISNDKNTLERACDQLIGKDILFYTPQIIACLARKQLAEKLSVTLLELCKDMFVSHMIIWNLRAHIYMNEAKFSSLLQCIQDAGNVARMDQNSDCRISKMCYKPNNEHRNAENNAIKTYAKTSQGVKDITYDLSCAKNVVYPRNCDTFDKIDGDMAPKSKTFDTSHPKKMFMRTIQFFDDLTNVSSIMMQYRTIEKDCKILKLNEILGQISIDGFIYLPTEPDYEILQIVPASGIPLQSAAKVPYLVTFLCVHRSHLESTEFHRLVLNLYKSHSLQECEPLCSQSNVSNPKKNFDKKSSESMQGQNASDQCLSDIEVTHLDGTDVYFTTGIIKSKNYDENNSRDRDYSTPSPTQPTKKQTAHSNSDISLDLDSRKIFCLEKIRLMLAKNIDVTILKDSIVRKQIILKAGDDCRQDILALQLIVLCRDIFKESNLDIFLYPYKVIATGDGTALIEVIPNAITRSQIGHERINNLVDYFDFRYGFHESAKHMEAAHNFVKSFAGFSLITYLLDIKDRHNANIMITDDGHILHIDFGFILGIRPKFNVESPIKMTKEIFDLLSRAGLAETYTELMVKGFLAVRRRAKELVFLLDVYKSSNLPCYSSRTVPEFTKRLLLGKSDHEAKEFMLSMIKSSVDRWGNWAYDKFQRFSNDIEC